MPSGKRENLCAQPVVSHGGGDSDLLRMFMDREPSACDNFFFVFLNSLTIIEVLFKEKDQYRFPTFDIQVSSPAVKRCNIGMFTACLTL